jgi:hypothetical protein
MLEKLLESLDKEVFTAEMVESIMTQFNESVEVKAKEIAEAELSEAVEKALAEAKEANEIAIQEALEAKTAEIEEKAEAYVVEALESKTAEIEEKAEEFTQAKFEEMNESLDLFMDKVVEEFIAESKEKLNESLKAEKADMIIESFEAMLTMGAVDVMKIAEAKDQSYADAKLTESVTKYDALMAEFLALKKENTDLAKAGIIAEMKEGLSLVESKKFETLAGMVPFSRDEKYASDLEVIKEQVKGTVEKTPEAIVESVVDSKKPIYSHLV